METVGSIVLDSGCTATVCGETWLESYFDSLSNGEKQNLMEEISKMCFKFDNGVKVVSKKLVTFLCILAGEKVNIKTDVVDCNIPLLLSRSAMKRAKMNIDFSNDSVRLFNKTKKLNVTSSGHYCIPILKSVNSDDVKVTLFNYGNKSEKEIAIKLHKQFAHPSVDKLKNLIKNAGIVDKKFLQEIEDHQ